VHKIKKISMGVAALGALAFSGAQIAGAASGSSENSEKADTPDQVVTGSAANRAKANTVVKQQADDGNAEESGPEGADDSGNEGPDANPDEPGHQDAGDDGNAEESGPEGADDAGNEGPDANPDEPGHQDASDDDDGDDENPNE